VRERALRPTTHGPLAAGDATFHAGWTLHRAPGNPTPHPRPVMTVIYFADGARVSEPDSVYQQFDLATWLPGLQPGEVAASRLNPRLWPPDGDG
jgi:ectoine hydroxylase-related dioxygenase (phytanoyl-CoA dioxygenase family)